MALTVVLLFSGLTGGQDSAEALDDSVAGLELITSPGANGETYFIKDDPQALTKGKHTTVPLPPDYKVQFEFTPEGEVVKSWSSIVHFSATGNNCCNYGDRVPAVWFYPGSRRLHVIDGHGPIGNDECAITEELEVGTKYTVTIEGYQKVVDVSLNGVVKCTEPRQDRRGGGFSRATVYASDEWYEPAHGTIDNFFMVPLEPITGCTDFAACNHDERASESDGSCVMQPRGFDCGGTHPIRTGTDGTTTLIPAGQQFALEQGSLHAVVPVPLDCKCSRSLCVFFRGATAQIFERLRQEAAQILCRSRSRRSPASRSPGAPSYTSPQPGPIAATTATASPAFGSGPGVGDSTLWTACLAAATPTATATTA